ncbi:MAG: hypothetical protein ACOYM3_34620 [Terrimicrobiaceae bacterium]
MKKGALKLILCLCLISSVPKMAAQHVSPDAEPRAGEVQPPKTAEQQAVDAASQKLTEERDRRIQKQKEIEGAEKLADAIRKSKKHFIIKVAQVLDDGVLADYYQGGIGGRLSGKIFFFSGVQGMAEGQERMIFAIPDGSYKFTDTSGAARTVEKWRLSDNN